MRSNGWLVLLSLLAFLAAAEGGLRLYDFVRGRSPTYTVQVKPYRIFGLDLYETGDGRMQIRSRHGETFPLEKPPETVRVVAFGGSTTVNKSVFTRSGAHYPLRVQQILAAHLPERNVEVINVGNEGYATSHSITMLALDVLSWDPDIVILSHNFNDLTASYFPGFRPDYSHKFAHDYYVPGLDELLLKRSRLYRLADARLRRLASFPIRRRSYGPTPPAPGQAVFERNLRSFVTLAQANRITVILGTQPLEATSEQAFDQALRNKPYNAVVTYPEHEEFVLHHQAFNQIIRDVAQSTGSTLVDNELIFGGNSILFSDFLHYSEAGVERLARNYATAMIDAGLLRAALDHPRPLPSVAHHHPPIPEPAALEDRGG